MIRIVQIQGQRHHPRHVCKDCIDQQSRQAKQEHAAADYPPLLGGFIYLISHLYSTPCTLFPGDFPRQA